MLRFSFVIFFIANLHFCFAQEIIQGINGTNEKPADYKYVQGSCYFNDVFIDGRIILNTNQIFTGPVRYDIYADQIEFKNPANEIFIVQNPGAIRSVFLDTVKFSYFEPGEFANMNGFYEQLVLGNYSLYKKYQILLKNPEAAGPGLYSRAAMFIPLDSKYYIMDTDANFREIDNKKDLLIPGRDSDELEKFIKGNKIKTKKEEDLIRFTEFLNQD